MTTTNDDQRRRKKEKKDNTKLTWRDRPSFRHRSQHEAETLNDFTVKIITSKNVQKRRSE